MELFMFFLALAVVASHVQGMIENRYKPVMVLLGGCSLLCALTLIAMLVELKDASGMVYERWALVKRFSLVCAATIVLMAVKLNLAVPWWYATIGWLLTINVIVPAAVFLIMIDVNFDAMFG